MKLQNYEEFALNENTDSVDGVTKIFVSSDKKYLFDMQTYSWENIEKMDLENLSDNIESFDIRNKTLDSFVKQMKKDIEDDEYDSSTLSNFLKKDPEVKSIEFYTEITYKIF